MSKIPEGPHKLKIGRSFDKRANENYHTIRYDFKPASLDECKESYIEFGVKSEVTVSVPKLDQTSGDVKDVTLFRGSRKPCQKECLLIYDHDTGDFTLEELSSNIHLKQARSGEEEKEKNVQYVKDIRKKFKKPADHSPKKSDRSPQPPASQSADVLIMSDDGSEAASSDDDSEDDGKMSVKSAGSEDDIAKSLEAAVAAPKTSKGSVSLERDLHLSESSDGEDLN